MASTKQTTTFDDATRANWGRRDAENDRANGFAFRSESWLDAHFDQAYAAGYREVAQTSEPAPFVPFGRCRIHPSVETSVRGFDVPCYKCESEMAAL